MGGAIGHSPGRSDREAVGRTPTLCPQGHQDWAFLPKLGPWPGPIRRPTRAHRGECGVPILASSEQLHVALGQSLQSQF